MDTALRKIGNSTGLVVPKPLLDALGLVAGRRVSVRVVDKTLVIEPEDKPHPRAGWEAASVDLLDEPLDYDWLNARNKFDDEEWVW